MDQQDLYSYTPDKITTNLNATISGIPALVWAAGTRTLSSFGTLVADVWAYATRTLTQSAITTASQVSGSDITLQRGDTLSASVTGLGNISTRTKLWFTVKRKLSETDAQSIIQIEETAGLLYFNGAAATAGSGSITVSNETTGALTVALIASLADDLNPASGLYYDFQMLAGTTVSTLASGKFNIPADVTRAVA
jgi:hypothetical protein